MRQILDGILGPSDAEGARWMQASFDARDVVDVPVVVTSHPHQRAQRDRPREMANSRNDP